MAPIGSRRSGEHALNSTIEIRAAAALTSYIFTLEPDSCVSSDGTDLSRKNCEPRNASVLPGQPVILRPPVRLVPSLLPARSKSVATETCNARASFSML